jgi:hypothetical protein
MINPYPIIEGDPYAYTEVTVPIIDNVMRNISSFCDGTHI